MQAYPTIELRAKAPYNPITHDRQIILLDTRSAGT